MVNPATICRNGETNHRHLLEVGASPTGRRQPVVDCAMAIACPVPLNPLFVLALLLPLGLCMAIFTLALPFFMH